MTLLLAGVLAFAGGCGAQAGWKLGKLDPDGSQAIRTDPIAYLEGRLDACRALSSYTTVMYRQERLGALIKRLRPLEKVLALYRREPLAVRLIWLEQDSKYVESFYAEDQNDGKQMVLERHGLFGGKGLLWTVNPDQAVSIGEAKYPIVDFGVARLMEKTLRPLREVPDPRAYVDYKGIHQVDLTGQRVHLFEIRGTVTADHPLQELMIDTATGLPAGTRLWLDADKTRLAGMYLYTDLTPDAALTSEHLTFQGPIPNGASAAHVASTAIGAHDD